EDSGSGAATVHWFTSDHQNSLRKVYASGGSVSTTYDYDAFGNITSSVKPERFGYAGYQYDAETGLNYCMARYYDPAQARFISQDPAGMAGSGTNLYDYVGNDPVDLSDPSGLKPPFGGSNFSWDGGGFQNANNTSGGGDWYEKWLGKSSTVPADYVYHTAPAPPPLSYMTAADGAAHQRIHEDYLWGNAVEDNKSARVYAEAEIGYDDAQTQWSVNQLKMLNTSQVADLIPTAAERYTYLVQARGPEFAAMY